MPSAHLIRDAHVCQDARGYAWTTKGIPYYYLISQMRTAKYMDLHFGIGLLDLAGVKYMGGSRTCLGALFTQTLKIHFWVLGLVFFFTEVSRRNPNLYFQNFLLFQTFLIRSHGGSNPHLLNATEVL
jgi:hypothetical protein